MRIWKWVSDSDRYASKGARFQAPYSKELSDWIWWLLGIFTVAGLVLVVVQHQHQDRFDRPVQVISNVCLILDQALVFDDMIWGFVVCEV